MSAGAVQPSVPMVRLGFLHVSGDKYSRDEGVWFGPEQWAELEKRGM